MVPVVTIPWIRPAAQIDVPAITAIYADAVLTGTATFELDPPDETEMERRRAELVAGGFPYFVAIRENQVLGYAYAGPYRARPAYRFAVEDSIYLAPDARRQGIGRALLAALIETSTARGFRQMLAVIGDSQNAGSVAVHRALGFRLVGTFADVGWKHGRWLDTVLMQLPLGPGSSTMPGG
jgi:phosphinothricin acetyltransferase